MNKEINCSNCNYLENIDNTNFCTIHKYTSGVKFEVSERLRVNGCVNHSDKDVEEYRYMRENEFLRDAEDHCRICGRRVKTTNKENYIKTNIDAIPTKRGNYLVCIGCERERVGSNE